MGQQTKTKFTATLGVAAAIVLMAFGLAVLTSTNVFALTAKEIDTSVDETLKTFSKDVQGGKEVLNTAKGVLVMPRVIKGAIGIGGEYGEGALRIDGKTVDYYNVAAASWGFQFGGQAKTLILAFLQQEALDKFRNSAGFEVGVDGSIAVISVGKSVSVDTNNLKDPIVAFAIDTKGAMIDLSLSGSKFTKMNK